MKRVIFLFVVTCGVFYSDLLMSNNRDLEDYIYAFRIEGLAYQADSQGEIKEIRRMEKIKPGTVLSVEKGTVIYLTCGGCKIKKLTSEDGSYRVKMDDFIKNKSSLRILPGYLIDVLKNIVVPGSNPGKELHMGVRGRGFFPPDHQEIMPISGQILFKLEGEKAIFLLNIREDNATTPIYTIESGSQNIVVETEKLEPGKDYKWKLEIKDARVKRGEGTFRIISQKESTELNEKLNKISLLTRQELNAVDDEIIYRLQAGYLRSEGRLYDAWHWLEYYCPEACQ